MFEKPYIVDTKAEICTETEKETLTVHFKMAYVDTNGIERTIETQKLIFRSGETNHVNTTIGDEEGNEIEIVDYISKGGTYDKNRIISWGYPSMERLKLYFDIETIWTSLEFKEQPLKQLAIDWLMQALLFESLPIYEGFEYEQKPNL